MDILKAVAKNGKIKDGRIFQSGSISFDENAFESSVETLFKILVSAGLYEEESDKENSNV